MNERRFTSSPIHAPNHEFDEMEIIIPLISVVNKRIFVELLDIRMESVCLYLRGMNPLAFLAYLSLFCCILVYGAREFLILLVVV
jgi:hypothetical protein